MRRRISPHASRGTAGRFKQAVVPLLHLLEHLEKQCFTFTGRLGALAGFLQFFTEDLELFA
jgi:hypothetical protein